MTLCLVETATGAQILPPQRPGDPHGTINSYLAHMCCDADQRRFPEYRDIAAKLSILVDK